MPQAIWALRPGDDMTPSPQALPWPADPDHIDRAARAWARGELVAFPTETVYGLGGDAAQAQAVQAIFDAKGRPNDHPLIVHVGDAAQAMAFAASCPPAVERLMAKAWPGPLTLILPRRPGVAQEAAAGQDSIGIRCPDHPVAQALLRAALAHGVPGVAGPSANRFGRVSPTRASHVIEEFAGRVPVVDGGACAVGIESTIVDATRDRLVVLRPGHFAAEQLSQWAGQTVWGHDQASGPAPRASGTLESHYAPRARVRLFTRAELLARGQSPAPLKVAVWSPDAPPPGWAGPWRIQPSDAQACAHDLYAALRELDATGVDELWVAQVPQGEGASQWWAVADRLRRAAA